MKLILPNKYTSWQTIKWLIMALTAFVMTVWPEPIEYPEPPVFTPPAPVLAIVDPCSLDDIVCPEERVKKVILSTVFTYQAVPEQTDGDACTTASGLDICDPFLPFGVVANNCLPFHTEVLIRGESYWVKDRMNKRYGCDTFDILTRGEVWKWKNEPVSVLYNN